MLIGGLVVGLVLTVTPLERADRFEGALTGRIEQIEKELADITLNRPTLTGAYVLATIGGASVVLAVGWGSSPGSSSPSSRLRSFR